MYRTPVVEVPSCAGGRRPVRRSGVRRTFAEAIFDDFESFLVISRDFPKISMRRFWLRRSSAEVIFRPKLAPAQLGGGVHDIPEEMHCSSPASYLLRLVHQLDDHIDHLIDEMFKVIIELV